MKRPTTRAEKAWQKLGKEKPYFGVISHPEFDSDSLGEDSLKAFHSSGERHVQHVLDFIRENLRADFLPNEVLDYGCGTGRLILPFAHRSRNVVGVDISNGMLERARENCDRYSASHVRLLHVDDMDSLGAGNFDLVHSFIVFQHIPVSRGEPLLRKLVGFISGGGIGAIHVTFSDTRSWTRRAVWSLRCRIPLAHGLLNVVKGIPFSRPLMQMNTYSMNRVLDILIDSHCSNLHIEFSSHGGFRGAMLYFQKSAGGLDPTQTNPL